MKREPLVSILIPNYNYAKYLRHCLDSVINQTYSNIEIIIQDNASTDNSYEILMEYQMKYLNGQIDKYINVGRNKRNVGSDRNSTICVGRAEGTYFMFLSSDDALKPTYVERCVAILENNPDVSMVMTHRDEIEDNGTLHKVPPFYNKSFIVNGEAQAAVFMMAGIAVPTQVFFRKESRSQTMKYRFYQMQVAGDWYNNFLMACVGDIAYIKDALCEYRVHYGNETNESEKKLLGIFEHFVIINAFNSTAKSIGFEKPQERYIDAIEKLGDMCLRYTLKMLQNNEFRSARKYLQLAVVFKENITEDKRYKDLWRIINFEGTEECDNYLHKFEESNILDRTVSYDPPIGFYEIDVAGRSISK